MAKVLRKQEEVCLITLPVSLFIKFRTFLLTRRSSRLTIPRSPMPRTTIRLLLLSASIAHIALGQTGVGSVQGTVRDATGAVIPAAQVTLRQAETAYVYETTSNSAGLYLFPSVNLGPYELKVSTPGMDDWQGKLTLQAGQSATVDVMMKIRSTETTVTVAGDVTPLVTVNSPTIATTVERSRIEQLPLNGRYVYNLVGVTTPGFEGNFTPRLYGLRGAIEYYQDGAVVSGVNPRLGPSELAHIHARTEPKLVEEARLRGVNVFLGKPVNFVNIVKTVKRLLEQRLGASPG